MNRYWGRLRAESHRRIRTDDTRGSMRRKLLVALGASAFAPTLTFAQPAVRVWRIGFFGTAFASGYVKEVAWIRNGLKEFGYEEGKNVRIEYRWAEGKPERIREIAAEFVALKVDAILTHGLPGAMAAAKATSAIPIVMADGSDPVAAGLAASLARPGGNVTGSVSFVPEESAKRLELIKEVAPRTRRVAFIVSAQAPVILNITRKALENAAVTMKVELQEFVMQEAADLPDIFNGLTKSRIDAIIINNEPMLNSQASVLAALANSKRMAAVGNPTLVDSGILLGYGSDRQVLYTRAAYFLDRIFKGSKPGEIPFERASRFQFALNLKTAKAIGVDISQSLLSRADKVIE